MGSRRGARAQDRLLPLMLGVIAAVGMLVVPLPRPARADPLPTYPIVTLDPDCFQRTDIPFSYTLKGRNFEPNATIVITEYSSEFDPARTVTVVAGAYGSFTAGMTLSLNQSFPNFRLDVFYASDLQNSLTSAYGGYCSSDTLVVAQTSCGDPDNPAIHVTGGRYGRRGVGSDITVQLRQGDVDIGAPTIVPANDTFDVTWQPGVTLSPGEYTVVATQSAIGAEYFWYGYDTFLVPCPQVTIEPTCASEAGAPPGRMSIMVSGIGWQRQTADGADEIQVVIDPDGEPQEFSFYHTYYDEGPGIGEDGSFGSLEINPYLRPRGTYTIQIKQQQYRSDPLLEVRETFTVPCLEPVLALDPTCGPPQLVGDVPGRYSIRASGDDFLGGLPLTVIFDPDFAAGSDYPPESFNTTTGRDGTFSIVMDVAYRPPGTYRVVATQPTRFGVYEANAFFSVPCFAPTPSVTIDPTCGPVATNLPLAYSVTLVGVGFVPGQVDLVFDPTALVPEPSTAVADEFGAFNATIQVNGRPPGAYLFVASQTTSAGILDQVSVPFLVACEGVLLRIMPTSGKRGFVPLVEGFNFPALTTLTLRWDRGIGSSRPMTVQTDENGTFRRQVLIFHGDFAGPRRMTVELPTDPLAYPDVGVDYLVTQPTVSPPFSLADNPFAEPNATIIFRR